jgi:hypothetical protein
MVVGFCFILLIAVLLATLEMMTKQHHTSPFHSSFFLEPVDVDQELALSEQEIAASFHGNTANPREDRQGHMDTGI